jgi:flagellar basal-body rod modification protein FlgD
MTTVMNTVAPPAAEAGVPQSNADPAQIASKEAFLRLLVAQIKNQNPLNPADGVQFLTQLAQFSELEQMIGIRQELESLHATITAPAAPSGEPEQPAA